MIAAENDAISGAKVGGMADVIRDLPPTLASEGIAADVAMPNYGYIGNLYGAANIGTVSIKFGANVEFVNVLIMPRPNSEPIAVSSLGDTEQVALENVSSQVYLFDHPLFNSADNEIYSSSSHDRPFADDATKFALFNLAVAQAYVDGLIAPVDVLHMHDWHAGLLVMLRAFDPQYAVLQQCQCVFSIHNLALQGIRPIRDDVSSFTAWYPQLSYQLSDEQKSQLCDPRYPHCINPMKMGIVLSDKVHLVSPTYANEVLMPSDHLNGFFGGEGLETAMQEKHARGDIIGILNGCVYDSIDAPLKANLKNNSTNQSQVQTKTRIKQSAQALSHFLKQSQNAVIKWLGRSEFTRNVDQIALTRLQQCIQNQTSKATGIDFLMTSVGRLTDQKVLLLRQPYGVNQTTLDAMLIEFKTLKPQGLFVLLGSGDSDIAKEFQQVASKHDNFVFLNGYDQHVSELMYQLGDLFIMPSSFEPCGISQLLAMKEGQPCIAHGVGGLRDTIKDLQTGWLFEGNNLTHQSEQLIKVMSKVLTLSNNEPKQFSEIGKAASEERFSWQMVAKQYRQKLYS